MRKILNTVGAEFLVDVKTVTPMLQIEPTSSKNKDALTKASNIVTKKRKYIAENGQVTNVPFFSANGYRGIVRRNLASTIFGVIENKDNKKFSLNSIHLYASGGGTSNDGLKDLNYAQKLETRKANPFISCFGAGLSDIDGKLSVSDIVPCNKDGKEFIGHQFGVRFDESQRSSVLTPLLDIESVEKYNKEIESLKVATKSIVKLEDELKKLKDARDKGSSDKDIDSKINDLEAQIAEEKEAKGMSYQQTYKAEMIVPGTQMSSSIGARAGHELSELERGMVLYGLIQTSQQSIGSYSRVGWGTCEWEVKNSEGETLFRTVPDEKYVLQKYTTITPLGEKMIQPFLDYLEQLDRGNIFLMD